MSWRDDGFGFGFGFAVLSCRCWILQTLDTSTQTLDLLIPWMGDSEVRQDDGFGFADDETDAHLVGSNSAKFSRREDVHFGFADARVACSHGLRILRGIGTLNVDLQTLGLLVSNHGRFLRCWRRDNAFGSVNAESV